VKLRQSGTYNAGFGIYSAFHFDLENPEDFKVWSQHCYGPAWYRTEVHGPRED
jgi:hypothetical protein